VLQVNFFNVPEYSGQQTVLVDGSLNLPALGNLSVLGLSLAEAEATIATRYATELRHPQVTVTLLRARPLRVGIVGEVSQPGLYTLPLAEGAQQPTVAQLIQTAGGTTQAADLRQIEIRRPDRAGSVQVIAVNLWEFLQNGDLSQNIALQDGDTIVIAATADVNLVETAQLAASNLAANSSQILDVALVGEVSRPGAYKLEAAGEVNDRPTLTRAIQTAGGITSSADLRQVEVRRITRAGREQIIRLDLWQLLLAGDLSQDLILQQGDTVIIPTAAQLTPEELVRITSANLSPSAIRVNVVGQVAAPGTVEVPAGTTLNQAILAAGGFNRRADRDVQLIRLNPDGTVSRETIDIDLSQSIDPATNPILRNSDVVVVRRSGFASVTDGLDDVGGVLSSILRLISPF
jgi:protein involved in polysaccharide export with SLBB domain